MMLEFGYNSKGEIVATRGNETMTLNEVVAKHSFDVGMDIVKLTSKDADRVINIFDKMMWNEIEFQHDMSVL